MTTLNRLGALLVLSALFFAGAALRGPIASSYGAIDCSGSESSLFTGDYIGSGFWATSKNGTQGNLLKSDRDLNPDCTLTPPSFNMAGSTAHFSLKGVEINQIETGWGEFFNNSAQHQWRIFTEYELNGTGQDVSTFTFPCSIPNGTSGIWSVGNQPVGSATFHLSVSCDGGSTFYLLKSYTTTDNNGTGLPMAEEFRRGGDATGMSDTQSGLQFKDSTGWHAWADNKCYRNAAYAANWDSVRDSATSFHTILDSTPTCTYG